MDELICQSQVIALSGCKGSGKDYCADILRNQGFVVLSFSDQLKIIAANIFDRCRVDVSQAEKKDTIYTSTYGGRIEEYTHRDIWCKLNVLVEIDPMILVRPVLGQAMAMVSVGRKVCIKDLRPHNQQEHLACIKLGAQIIYIENLADPIPVIGRHETEDEAGYQQIRNSEGTLVYQNFKSGPEDFTDFISMTREQYASQF